MVYNYTYSKHNETLLDGLSAQRQNQSHFCDITIKTRDDLQNEVIIFGHKCVLATTSDHLNSIINMEENQQHNLEYDMSTIADAGTVSYPPFGPLSRTPCLEPLRLKFGKCPKTFKITVLTGSIAIISNFS